MADGFVLNVDAKFLQDLEKADKKMSDLVDKSNSLSKSVVEAFNKMSAQGVDPFLEKLRQQKTALEALANVDIGKNPSKGIRDLVKSAEESVDQINKLIIALQGAGTAMDVSRATKKVDSEIKKETDSYLKELEKQINARQEYLSRQERVEQERVKITQDATKQVESEIKRETDEYLKNLEIKIKAAQEQQLRNDQIRSQRESIAKQAKENVEAEIKAENDAYLKGLNDRIRQAQEYQARNERVASERKRIESEVVKHVENEIKKEKDAHLKSLSDQIKARQEYLERVRKLQEAQAKKESEMRAKEFHRIQQYGDTSRQATSAYSRLYGEHGIKSINNMNRVMQQLQNAQNKLNLNTEQGKKKYDELEKKIRRVKRSIDDATESNNKFHQSHNKLINTTDQLQRKLALLFSVSAIKGYMDKLVNVRKEFELQQRSLQILLQDRVQADELWQKTIDLAVQSPFRVKELVTYTKQLAAYRIESDKLFDTTKMLSDVSAGLGVDMNRIILAFGQVRAANFLRGTELRQFTEAGIPMLDELAKRFTELEGRVVSTGDVFERISKRMVTFKDVEEVFKNMTSEGGVFYKMQEEQSKTLYGMISNLHDSIDLMLNDIGKSNDGVIKNMVTFTRELVENWRGVATILKQVGAAVAVINLLKFANGWKMVAIEGAKAAVAMNGAAGAGARLNVVLSTLGKTIKAHPWLMLVGALASAGFALWDYIDAVEAANEQYDEMSRNEIARSDRLGKITIEVEKYNKVIKDANATDEDRNNAIKKNENNLNELKSKYPEITSLIKQNADKTLELADAVEVYNNKLITNIALQQQAKGDFFQEDFKENYEDAVGAQANLENRMNDLKVAAMNTSATLSQLFSKGLIPQDTYDVMSKALQELRNAKGYDSVVAAYSKIRKLQQQHAKSLGHELNVVKSLSSEMADVNTAQQKYNKALSNFSANIDKQINTIKVSVADVIDSSESEESGRKAAGAWVSGYLENFSVVDETINAWAKEEIQKKINVQLVFGKDQGGSESLEPWAERVKKAINEINEKIKKESPNIKPNDLFPVPQEGNTKEQYLNLLNSYIDIAEATYREGQQIIDESVVNQTKALKPHVADVKNIINQTEKIKKEGSSKDWLSETIKGVKEAHQEFLKLNKTLSETEARQLALEKYKDVFAEAAKNAGLSGVTLSQFKFQTEQGTIDALEFLRDKLPSTAKQARMKLEEALGEIKGEFRIQTKEENDQKLIQSIEDMFSGYELSLELEKLNIPPDLAKQLFNVESLTLPELKDQIIAMKPQFIGKDMEKEYNDFLKKIDEMEEKAQMERLKKYTQYLIKGQGERVKIKMDEMRQLAEIESTFTNEEQQIYKNRAKNAVQKEAKKKIDKETWSEFQDSDLFVKMFEDMEYVSSKALDVMEQKLIEFKKNLTGLDLHEIRSINKQLEKIQEAKVERNPFKILVSDVKEYIKAIKNIKSIESSWVESHGKEDSLKKQVEIAQALVAQSMDEYNSIVKKKGVYSQEAFIAKQLLKTNEKNLDILLKELVAQGKITKEYAEQLANAETTQKNWEKSLLKVGSYISEGANILPQIASDLENVFGAMDAGTRDTIESISEIGSGVGDAIQGFASQNYIQAVGGVIKAIGGIFAIGDKKKERQIQREIEKVDELNIAYQKLEKAIDNAYSIDTLQASGEAAKANLEAQIDSYEKMIAAEEDKKKTDKDRIKEWELQIEEIREQVEEMNKGLVSTATAGIMDSVLSASQEFTNAWLEAFNETGDGLSGLSDNFKSTMLEMVKQQAAMLISQSYVEKWKKQLEQYINPDDLELSTDEAKKWVDAVTSSLPQLNEALENYFTAMQQAGVDLGGEASGELSGLQRGIQSVSESTAQIIEAYLNSVRFYVADSNSKLTMIANQIIGSDETTNPILSELRTQTELVRGISTLLNSMTTSYPNGGRGWKVVL